MSILTTPTEEDPYDQPEDTAFTNEYRVPLLVLDMEALIDMGVDAAVAADSQEIGVPYP